MGEDLIGIVEAAYRCDLPETEWLAGISDASAKVFDRGLGVCSYLYSFRSPGEPKISQLHCSRNFDPSWLASWYARRGQSPQPVGNTPVGSSHWMNLSCASASQIRRLRPMLDGIEVFGGARDVFSINGRDPGGFGLRLGIPLPRKIPLSGKRRQLYARVAAHFAAGYRVRRSLVGDTAPQQRAEAVLSTAGAILHAEREASSRAARDELRHAARRLDRARSRDGRRDADAATDSWKGLVDARWTLLDHFDDDGKHFILATRNDVALVAPALLSDRERQVLSFAALRHTNKEIAYELGLAAPTVRVLMVRAARKLGARGRADAIARFHARRAVAPEG